jgi:Outer membrane receptor proteins, mostly Fe transport
MTKGPASILFGRIDPGGVINLVTKRPLDIPYYTIDGAVEYTQPY